ncbi:YoaK family protein [Herbaspirillum sp. RV1423]|uniref:YoaK family protein n=1 Tax=Herbaspirillum sp. RV1423 TaxID=1443993 RepID=UPI0004B41AAB|nr:YoaK family protein [Herbaspirillum sp. RV1423]
MDKFNRATCQSIAMSFLAGYVDTVGFVALFGLFTAHVTGNFVLIGSELANPSHGVLIKFLAFPAFIASVVLTRMAVIWLERSGKPALPYVLALQLLFLLAFMSIGQSIAPVADARATAALLAGMFGAAAMGVQNAASRLILPQLTPTTVMTGNVTQLVIDVVDVLRGAADAGVRQRCIKFFWPIVAFGAGAIGGAFAYRYALFLALLLPAAILVAMIRAEYIGIKAGLAATSSL